MSPHFTQLFVARPPRRRRVGMVVRERHGDMRYGFVFLTGPLSADRETQKTISQRDGIHLQFGTPFPLMTFAKRFGALDESSFNDIGFYSCFNFSAVGFIG